MKRIARSAIVEHSARELYKLVENIEAYPSFLPWCLEAKVEERSATSTRATLTAGLRGLRQSFTTQNDTRPGEAIEMRLVHGPFRRFKGEWRFAPLGEQACRIEFALEYQFSSRALGRVLEPLFDHIADTMVDAFKRRSDEVYGRAES